MIDTPAQLRPPRPFSPRSGGMQFDIQNWNFPHFYEDKV